MARRSLFGRISDSIKSVFRREPSRPEPPPPPPPPVVPPGDYGGGGDSPFRDAWDRTVTERDLTDIQERTGWSENELFQLHYEILYSLDPEADQETLEEMWQDYLMAFVSDGMSHDRFFETWYIDPRDFDWATWREAMGYNENRK